MAGSEFHDTDKITTHMNALYVAEVKNDTNSSSEYSDGVSAKLKLLEANDTVAMELLPVMLFLGLLSIVGVVGNSLVCFIFTRRFSKSSQNYLIIALAAFDLHTCILTIPYEIIDLRFYVYYIFDTDLICKIFKFVNTFCNSGSILVLLVIAIDRYRKVCKPLQSQLKLHGIRITFIVIFLISACYSIPIFFLYGYRTIPSNFLSGAKSRDCSTPDGLNTLYPTLFNGILFLTFTIISASLVIMYSKILTEVKRRNKHKKGNLQEKISYGETNNISQGTEDDLTIVVTKASTSATIRVKGTSPENGANKNILGAVNLGPSNFEKQRQKLGANLTCQSNALLGTSEINNNNTSTKQLPLMAPTASETPKHLAVDSNDTGFESGVSIQRSVSDVTPEIQKNLGYVSEGLCPQKGNSQASVMRSCSDPHPRNEAQVRKQAPDSGNQTSALVYNIIGKAMAGGGKRSASSKKRRRARYQTTLVAFSVSTVFILSFLPHLTLMIAKLVIFPGFDQDLRGSGLVAYNLMVRSYFINSMCNPLIYGILNAQFRQQVKRILRRVSCKGDN